MTLTETITQQRKKKIYHFTGTSTVNRVPTAIPNFTIKDIRSAIPPHCFQRPLWKSFGYLLFDLVIMAIMFNLTRFIESEVTTERFGKWSGLIRHALWILYWCIQGSVMTGMWVIGHECGHGGFSEYEMVNDVVGLITHSALLVPFFSWKTSHRRHHSNTGNIEKDEVFVPEIEEAATFPDFLHFPVSKPKKYNRKNRLHLHPNPDPQVLVDQDHTLSAILKESIANTKDTIVRMYYIVVMLTVGWPGYLFFNVASNKSYPTDKWANHFLPSSPVFTSRKERVEAVISDLALMVVVGILVYLSSLYSFIWLFKVYGVPYLITNMFLVLITHLQHTDPVLPHYNNNEWDWLRGALTTIDRDYGILNRFHHHIGDTHIAHHLFSSIPHYHAQEATEAVKKILGPYYRQDSRPILVALWNNFSFDKVSRDPNNPNIFWF